MSARGSGDADDSPRDKPTDELLQDIKHDDGTDTEFWKNVRRNYED